MGLNYKILKIKQEVFIISKRKEPTLSFIAQIDIAVGSLGMKRLIHYMEGNELQNL